MTASDLAFQADVLRGLSRALWTGTRDERLRTF